MTFDFLDRWWERLKARSRRLQLADRYEDQTHVSHALVTVLLFGSLGAGLGLLMGRTAAEGLSAGIVGGWAFYFAREIHNRWGKWRYKSWDGICDVVVPLWVTAPIVFRSALLLWLLSLAVALLYFVFRPIDGGRP